MKKNTNGPVAETPGRLGQRMVHLQRGFGGIWELRSAKKLRRALDGFVTCTFFQQKNHWEGEMCFWINNTCLLGGDLILALMFFRRFFLLFGGMNFIVSSLEPNGEFTVTLIEKTSSGFAICWASGGKEGQ